MLEIKSYTINKQSSCYCRREGVHWEPVHLCNDAALFRCLGMIYYIVPHPVTGDADTKENHDDGQDGDKDDDQW